MYWRPFHQWNDKGLKASNVMGWACNAFLLPNQCSGHASQRGIGIGHRGEVHDGESKRRGDMPQGQLRIVGWPGRRGMPKETRGAQSDAKVGSGSAVWDFYDLWQRANTRGKTMEGAARMESTPMNGVDKAGFND